MIRTRLPKKIRLQKALQNPMAIHRNLCQRSFFYFFKYFWGEVSSDKLVLNWHINYLCTELQGIAERVGDNKIKKHDLLINIPPGSTKTIICSIMFPAWCWTNWYWLRFITAGYSSTLSLEAAEYSRDLIRTEKFKKLFPELAIKQDKDTKSNFRIIKKDWVNAGRLPQIKRGGNRFSTSVGGTLVGFHAHILIWDDPLNPQKAVSVVELNNTNRWIDQILPTRKTDKEVSVIIGIMQRLHQNDPSGHILAKKKKNLRHICLPGQLDDYSKYVFPKELGKYYVNNLLDPKRLNRLILKDLESDLGQYGFAGQIGQNPTPPGGGMFKVDNFSIIDITPEAHTIVRTIRYWDKAGTKDAGAYTVGCKMCILKNGKFVIIDIKRGRWASEERESIIRMTAEADGKRVIIYMEQEGGSGGKESAEATIRNLVGFSAYADIPRGDKVYRADPYSVQVNNGQVHLLRADWNGAFIEEHRFFPFSTYKDQVDASSGSFTKLVGKKKAKAW